MLAGQHFGGALIKAKALPGSRDGGYWLGSIRAVPVHRSLVYNGARHHSRGYWGTAKCDAIPARVRGSEMQKARRPNHDRIRIRRRTADRLKKKPIMGHAKALG
jgi:hypothetical protein